MSVQQRDRRGQGGSVAGFVSDLFAEGRLRQKGPDGRAGFGAPARWMQALIAERCAESLSLDKLAREAPNSTAPPSCLLPSTSLPEESFFKELHKHQQHQTAV